jgi:hypothetical protein
LVEGAGGAVFVLVFAVVRDEPVLVETVGRSGIVGTPSASRGAGWWSGPVAACVGVVSAGAGCWADVVGEVSSAASGVGVGVGLVDDDVVRVARVGVAVVVGVGALPCDARRAATTARMAMTAVAAMAPRRMSGLRRQTGRNWTSSFERGSGMGSRRVCEAGRPEIGESSAGAWSRSSSSGK